MEQHAALIAWSGALVAVLGAAAPFLAYRRPQRRADLALDLWLHPRQWLLVAALVAGPPFLGLPIGIVLIAHPDAVLRSAGIALVLMGLAPIAPLIGAEVLRRRRRGEARA